MGLLARCRRSESGRRWSKFVLLVAVLGLVLRCSVADVGRVAGDSMQPALRNGDCLVTNKLAYGLRLPFTNVWLGQWSQPQRGDIVLLCSPVDGRRLVKRIAAVPGDRMEDGSSTGATVPSGQYFLRGDGCRSLDSRAFGCVPREYIMGRVVLVFTSTSAEAAPRRKERRSSPFPRLPAIPRSIYVGTGIRATRA